MVGLELMGNIKPSVIAECRDKLLSEKTHKNGLRSPSTVVRYLASLSSLMSTAEKEWKWISENPVKKVTKPQEPKGRMRYLTDLLLALSSGMRRSEVLQNKD